MIFDINRVMSELSIEFYKQLWKQIKIKNIKPDIRESGIYIFIPNSEYFVIEIKSGTLMLSILREIPSFSVNFCDYGSRIIGHKTILHLLNSTTNSTTNVISNQILFECQLANPKCFKLSKNKLKQELNRKMII
jgi:hypothetical protein